MTDLTAAVLERLGEFVDIRTQRTSHEDLIVATDALRAVLDAHQPETAAYPGHTVCFEDGHDWPCATVAGIAQALGVSGE